VIYGSVCSGIEAASAAWHPLGWDCRFVSEIEPFPKRALAHHYPTVPDLGDFTTIGADRGPIDVLVGGTPCQSFSVAGLRKGLDDPRGNLMLEFGALARRVRARWLVWENVPGVLSNNEGRDFGTFLGMLGELGYGFAYRVLDAEFFGVAQRRRRVFVVGHSGGLWQRAAAVLFERESLRGDPPPSREARERPSGTLAARTRGGGGLGIDHELDGGLVAHSLTGNGFDASEDGTGRGTPLVPTTAGCLQERDAKGADSDTKPGHLIPVIPWDPNQITSKANRSTCTPGAPMHCLPAAPAAPAVAFPWQQGGSMGFHTSEELCGALIKNQVHAVHAVHAVRRLTPRECERLQGFPDDYTAIPGAKDGPRYKALGNSMAVPVMAWIGRRIQMVEEVVK
jgi:DNA (cytosine-5)-methyltransferase 1